MSESESVLEVLNKAVADPDNYAVVMVYRDKKGKRTKRTVSPVEIAENKAKFGALCLCREELRSFLIEGVESATLVRSHEVLAPVQIEEL